MTIKFVQEISLQIPLSPENGGTGFNNGTYTFQLGGNTIISMGGIISLGGYTFTVLEDLTALGRTNTLSTGRILFASGINNAAASSSLFWTGSTFIIGDSVVGSGVSRFSIKGPSASLSGPHFATYVDSDTYPVLHFLSYNHDNMEITFDGYFDGAWRSSDAGSNYQIRKSADAWSVFYDSAVAQGNTITWVEGFRLDTDGMLTGFGDIRAAGDFISRKASVDYTGYLFVPLTTYLTSTAWDGDARGDTSKTLIDLSAVFGAPPGIKAVALYIAVNDSGSATSDTWLILSDDNGAGTGIAVSPMTANDRAWRGTVIVPCNANGDIYYEVNASSAGAFDVVMQIIGYWI